MKDERQNERQDLRVAPNPTPTLSVRLKVDYKNRRNALPARANAEAEIFTKAKLKQLHTEADELTAIFVSIVKNVKNKKAER